ncbi:MAG: amino acid adenylation domain-containing protein [Opitutaceae bacterium]|nr:amino acid adenylation domain-containing protein [Opitutaceae bacterium]
MIENSPDRIADFNPAPRDFPDQITLQELFEAQVRQRPLQTAVICDHDPVGGTSTFSYERLNEKANQLAHRLRDDGVLPGDIVAILAERSFAMLIGIHGVLKAGGAYLPLSPEDPPERIAYILADAGVRVVLVHGATATKEPADVRVIDIEAPHVFAGPITNPALVNRPDDLAYVIYTSGSTGKPKGVMIEHRSVVNRLHWMQQAYPIGEGDVLLQKTPYYFDVSVWELFWGLIEGASLCLLRPHGERAPQSLLETIRKHRVSVLHFVPSMLSVFLEYLDGRPEKVSGSLSSLRRVFASGEALSPAHARKFNDVIGEATGCRLTNLYGPTEATVDVTYFDCPTEGDLDCVPIGRPIQNIRAYVMREGKPMSVGETGELWLAGVGLARGYLNNPKLTAERFVENPAVPGERIYRTGDLARWLPDGNLEYLGREDHQVKIRGLRIELGEIENNIRKFPAVADCVVVTKAYSESIVVIVAYLVARQKIDQAALKQHLQRLLPEYMVPSHFEEIAALPLTATGKVDRKALPEPVPRPKASVTNGQ